MKKRVLSLVLALVMLIGVLPVNMLAAEPADELPAQQTVTIETSLDSADALLNWASIDWQMASMPRRSRRFRYRSARRRTARRWSTPPVWTAKR